MPKDRKDQEEEYRRRMEGDSSSKPQEPPQAEDNEPSEVKDNG